MKRAVSCLVGGLVCLAFAASGCAKHEVVKADQGIAPTAASKPAAKAETAQPAKVKEQPAAATPAPAAQSEPVAAAVPQAGELKATLEKIYFAFDSSALSQDARDSLAKNAEVIKNTPDARVQIQGNCDERGSDDYNLALGEKRALAAKQYLTAVGIPADRLSVISYGKEKPVDAGHNEAAWAKNRRDDFVNLNK